MGFALEYPITRVFPWRRFTIATVGLSAVVLTILTVVNVAVVGYEDVTVLRSDFNTSEKVWWTKFQISPKSPCDAHTFIAGDIYTSNVSIMTNTVKTINMVPHATNSTPVSVDLNTPGIYGLEYANNLLDAPCNVTNQRTVYVQVNRQQKYVQGAITFPCQFPTDYVIMIDALYTSYSFFSPLPSNGGFTINDTRAAPIVQRTIDKLAEDLLVSVIVGFNESSGTKLDGITAWGFPFCPAFAAADGSEWMSPTYKQIQECNAAPVNLTLLGVDASFSNDSYGDINKTIPDAMRIAVRNYMHALSAASLGDIGIWNENNVFLSADMINKTIDPNDALTAALHANPSLGGWYGWKTNTTSAASQLRAWQPSDPDDQMFVVPLPEEGRTPAVIALSYLCHDPRLKSPLNFIISVVVADASMFGIFWGLFSCFASMMARRSRSSANYCNAHDAISSPEDVVLSPPRRGYRDAEPLEINEHGSNLSDNKAYRRVSTQELIS